MGFREFSQNIFDVSSITSIPNPNLRTAMGIFNQRFKKPALKVNYIGGKEHMSAFEVKPGDLVQIAREVRRFGIVEAVLWEYEYPWRSVTALSFDIWRLNALYALVWVAKRDLKNIRPQLTNQTEGLQMRWEQVVEQTRLALGQSEIARYINDPDPNKSNINPKNPILITKTTLATLRSPSLEQLTASDPNPQPEIRPRNKPMATQPDRYLTTPPPVRRAEDKSTPPPPIPIRKPRIEISLDNQTLETLKGWEVNRTGELLNLILPNNDSVTGTQLPPEIEGLTRMVLNMVHIQRGLPLVTHEDVLTNNQARLAIKIMSSNLIKHPKIENLANLYKVYRAKIVKDQEG